MAGKERGRAERKIGRARMETGRAGREMGKVGRERFWGAARWYRGRADIEAG